MKEIEIQKYVHQALSVPSEVYQTSNNKRLQILSPGKINSLEGPDFREIAILLNGMVIVGDAEFHRKSSNWDQHNHSNDSNYENVILHIVFEDDSKKQFPFETLVLEREKILNQEKIENKEKLEDVPASLEDLQNFALKRLLRKATDAQKEIKKNETIQVALSNFIKDFISRFNSKRRRPVYSEDDLAGLIANIELNNSYLFLNDLSNRNHISVFDKMQELLKSKFYKEGPHLRRELILNCILPMSVCLADEAARINLFLWYWSTPALNKYGVLQKKFPQIPQNFLWQQQGMLEYIKDYGSTNNVISELAKEYGFGQALSFYKIGRSPLQEESIKEMLE